MHYVDCKNTLSLNRLTVGAIGGRIKHDLCLLNGSHHGLLHLKHTSRLLYASRHVHGSHAGSMVALPIHQHLLLRGCLLIKLPLAGILVISLVRARLSVDDGGFAEELLRITHLAWDANLRDEAAVHGGGLRIGHRHLLWLHVLLLLMMGLILVHAWATTGSPARINWLAQLVHTVSVRAIVRIRASLAGIEVLAHNRLVILEATCASHSLVTTAVTALIAASGATPALPACPLKAIVNIAAVHTATHSAAILRVHATASTSAHLIVAIATTRCASRTVVSRVA